MTAVSNSDDSVRRPSTEEIRRILRIAAAEDTYAACLAVEQGRSALDAARLYHAVSGAVYYQRKDVRSMISLSRAGIHRALVEADRIAESDEEAAAVLYGEAKAIAYDLGANLWPGWQDEGIELSPADLATGLEAARLNLKLAEQLERPPLPRCNAHWLLGAQLLAGGKCGSAAEHFELARQQAAAADRPEYVQMAAGYAAIARLKQDSDRSAAVAEFDAAVGTLREFKSEDATFFAKQLESVRELFAGDLASEGCEER